MAQRFVTAQRLRTRALRLAGSLFARAWSAFCHAVSISRVFAAQQKA